LTFAAAGWESSSYFKNDFCIRKFSFQRMMYDFSYDSIAIASNFRAGKIFTAQMSPSYLLGCNTL
jgi:hypothetical protein